MGVGDRVAHFIGIHPGMGKAHAKAQIHALAQSNLILHKDAAGEVTRVVRHWALDVIRCGLATSLVEERTDTVQVKVCAHGPMTKGGLIAEVLEHAQGVDLEALKLLAAIGLDAVALFSLTVQGDAGGAGVKKSKGIFALELRIGQVALLVEGSVEIAAVTESFPVGAEDRLVGARHVVLAHPLVYKGPTTAVLQKVFELEVRVLFVIARSRL